MDGLADASSQDRIDPTGDASSETPPDEKDMVTVQGWNAKGMALMLDGMRAIL